MLQHKEDETRKRWEVLKNHAVHKKTLNEKNSRRDRKYKHKKMDGW